MKEKHFVHVTTAEIYALHAGTAAVLVVFILKIPELGTVSIGEALEWLFYVTLPNFCFSKALQDLSVKHQISKVCSELDEYVDRTEFCELIGRNDQSNPCCPGKH